MAAEEALINVALGWDCMLSPTLLRWSCHLWEVRGENCPWPGSELHCHTLHHSPAVPLPFASLPLASVHLSSWPSSPLPVPSPSQFYRTTGISAVNACPEVPGGILVMNAP